MPKVNKKSLELLQKKQERIEQEKLKEKTELLAEQKLREHALTSRLKKPTKSLTRDIKRDGSDERN